jgi:hypothetical protein
MFVDSCAEFFRFVGKRGDLVSVRFVVSLRVMIVT